MGCAVSPHTTPGGEHPHIRLAFPGGRLSTYGGKDRLDGAEAAV